MNIVAFVNVVCGRGLGIALDDTQTAAKDAMHMAGEKAGDAATTTKEKASDMAAGNFYFLFQIMFFENDLRKTALHGESRERVRWMMMSI